MSILGITGSYESLETESLKVLEEAFVDIDILHVGKFAIKVYVNIYSNKLDKSSGKALAERIEKTIALDPNEQAGIWDIVFRELKIFPEFSGFSDITE